MQDPTRQLVANLWSADSFTQGALALLRTLLAVTRDGIDGSPLKGKARVICGMIHLRPDGDYRGLVVLRPGADDAENAIPMRPSATIWKHVSERGEAAALNLPMGGIEFAGSWGELVSWPAVQGGGDWSSSASIQRLMDRDATHVCAVPLRSPGGAVRGMASIEVNSTAAIQTAFVWDRFVDRLQLLTDIATPALLSLPALSEDPLRDDPLLPVVGEAMAGVVQLLQAFAGMDETLLISGPTGAGKSRLARWCHARSPRGEEPFETVDLLSVPPEMQMAELFGWRKGAFTGAVRDQEGYVARAKGGTLFIDEIDKLSLEAQAGLLQLLETRRYRPLGASSSDLHADVRFVIGTNADLAEAIEEGRFREDLYYRINVLPVRLPPLDERRDEIPGWTRFMLERLYRGAKLQGTVSPAADAVATLRRQPWPGNLRQLDNVLRRAFAVALADQGPGASPLVVAARHMEQALGLEGGGGATTPGKRGAPLTRALRTAAAAFVDTAVDRHARGEPLDLDHTEAFRGAVLRAAFDRLIDLKEVYHLFGRDQVVASRNHQRDYKRESSKLDQLEELVRPPKKGSPFRR